MRQWTVAGFAAVGDAVHNCGGQVLLFGAKDDEGIAGQVVAQMKRKPASLVGALSIPLLAPALSTCSLVVSGDTGPMHIAAAMGVKVVGVFGPTDPAITGPAGPHHRFVRAPGVSGSCSIPRYPGAEQIMRRIPVDEVVAIVAEEICR